MSDIQSKQKLEKTFFIKINEKIKENFYMRLFGEFILSFLFIFIINIGITLGEAKIPFFYLIYNVNILMALWISSWVFIIFIIFQKTGLSSNFINLIISHGDNNINNKQFWILAFFQFIGGMLAAIIVWLIVIGGIENFNEDWTYFMGGTKTEIKGLFLSNTNPDSLGWSNIKFESGKGAYGFAALQGIINAFVILILFFSNAFVDKKYNNGVKSKAWRYIILIVVMAISTILYANTTNWVRLLAPAIMAQIDSVLTDGENIIIIWTTLIYILFQSIGLIFIHFFIKKMNAETNLKKKEVI